MASSNGLTPELVARWQLATARFAATSDASRSTTATPGIPTGSSQKRDKDASSSSGGLRKITDDDLFERIARLATTERPADAAPLVTYTTEAGPHGDVVKATPEFIAYMRRKVDGYGVESPCHRPVPDRPAQGAGGEPPVSRNRAHFLKSP